MSFLLGNVAAMGRSCIEGHYMTQLRDAAASIVESWRSIVMKNGS
jgi:hypothetical protein